MRVVSVNVSMGETVVWQGKAVKTSIFKKPVLKSVMVRRMNIDGDRQSDLAVHGGEFKAVYAYSLDHYAWWKGRLGKDLPPGMFGENLTVEGLDEEDVCVGDHYQVGGAVLEAVQPRLPCLKLAIRFADPSMVKSFLESQRWGVYLRVVQEGELKVLDEFVRLRRGEGSFSIPELARLYFSPRRDPRTLKRALGLPALPPHWREELGLPDEAKKEI